MTTTTNCSTPISWLRLEQYFLGELDDAGSAAVQAHVRGCAACAECLRRIEADDASMPLPPPIDVKSSPASNAKVSFLRVLPVVGTLAAAAVALLVVKGRDGIESPNRADEQRIKGSEIALTLVREDGGRVDEPASFYREGDTFKALVTCPPGMSAGWDLIVYEGGQPTFPLESAHVTCGNDAPFPGAFRIVGHERETICLVWNEDGPVDREALARTAPSLLERGRCMTLDPAD